tara:strand:- start:384 stop:542 length:159 start_codon:yes stop_codon:yes gene_type:complete
LRNILFFLSKQHQQEKKSFHPNARNTDDKGTTREEEEVEILDFANTKSSGFS